MYNKFWKFERVYLMDDSKNVWLSKKKWHFHSVGSVETCVLSVSTKNLNAKHRAVSAASFNMRDLITRTTNVKIDFFYLIKNWNFYDTYFIVSFLFYECTIWIRSNFSHRQNLITWNANKNEYSMETAKKPINSFSAPLTTYHSFLKAA